MPLTNKFLRYSPEITLEVFTLVYNKLIKKGWKSISIPTIYSQFCSKWNYIIDYKDDNQFYSSISNNNCDETTVQEILGYDPFVKKEAIPEYVECIGLSESKVRGWSNHYTIGNIYKLNSKPDYNVTYIVGDDNEEWACDFSQFKPSNKEAFDAQNKPKQPLKQVVHCTTQEEWDFVSNKIGYKFLTNFELGRNDTININSNTCECKRFYDNSNYNLLSFQEWCDLNGYKMEKEVKFEVGKWYKMNDCWYLRYKGKDIVATDKIYMSECIDSTFNHKYDNGFVAYLHEQKTWRLASLEEIQQYLPEGHPDKIKVDREFKVGDWVYHRDSKVLQIAHIEKDFDQVQATNLKIFGINSIRHATLEEINQHLISIGQIPAGEPLDTGIEPNKDGVFRYSSTTGSSWTGLTPTNHLGAIYQGDIMGNPANPKMILSIDDEELPMVSIIKTNTIKQLLNND